MHPSTNTRQVYVILRMQVAGHVPNERLHDAVLRNERNFVRDLNLDDVPCELEGFQVLENFPVEQSAGTASGGVEIGRTERRHAQNPVDVGVGTNTPLNGEASNRKGAAEVAPGPLAENLLQGGAVVARQAHNLEVLGAIPSPATILPPNEMTQRSMTAVSLDRGAERNDPSGQEPGPRDSGKGQALSVSVVTSGCSTEAIGSRTGAELSGPANFPMPPQAPRRTSECAGCETTPTETRAPRFYMWRKCSSCGLNFGILECAARDHGNTTHGICPTCLTIKQLKLATHEPDARFCARKTNVIHEPATA